MISFTLTELTRLAENASNLSERLSGPFEPLCGSNQDLSKTRMENWCRVAFNDNQCYFSRRLERLGHTPYSIRPYLGDIRLKADAAMPKWTSSFKQVMTCSTPSKVLKAKHEPAAFEELMTPFADYGLYTLNEQLDSSSLLYEESVTLNMAGELVSFLSLMSSQALFLEWSLYRRHNADSYRQFVDYMLDNGFKSFFIEYPVLARLMTEATELWVSSSFELLHKLQSDQALIFKTFSGRQDKPGQVAHIQTSLSDRHNGGKTLAKITYTDGLSIIYKPRDVSMELGWNRLLDTLNQSRGIPDLRVLKVLARPGYGWMEYADAEPLADKGQAESYYFSAGMLLALVHLLQGSDFHFENVIAKDCQPVLVDLETLMHPHLSGLAPDSLLRTGLLPGSKRIINGITYDISGFCSSSDIPSVRQVWASVNQDDMKPQWQMRPSPLQKNLPYWNGSPVDACNYHEAMAAGFDTLCCFFLENKSVVLESKLLQMFFSNSKCRFLFRSTREYAHFLQKAHEVKNLHFGIDRSLALECAASRFIEEPDNLPVKWLTLLQAELKALEQLDIPYFYCHTSSFDIKSCEGVVISEAFETHAMNRVLDKLRQFSSEHLNIQLKYFSEFL